MTVDSNARRQAILFEIAAVATRYEQDTTPGDDEDARMEDLWIAIHAASAARRESLRELAGRCVAWLEHLEAEKAKA